MKVVLADKNNSRLVKSLMELVDPHNEMEITKMTLICEVQQLLRIEVEMWCPDGELNTKNMTVVVVEEDEEG